MEQNEMFLAWKEMSDKLSEQEISNKKVLVSILENNRKSSFQRLLTVDRGGCWFICVTAIIVSCLIINARFSLPIKIEVVALMVTASVFNVISYLKLRNVNFEEPITCIFRKVASYRKTTIWAYIVCYILVFIFAINAWFDLPSPIAKIGIALGMVGGMFLDYIIFHWSMRNINAMRDMTKELNFLE